MSWYNDFLKKFFHDPIDKPFDIKGHEQRGEEYAKMFDVFLDENLKYADIIASSMERSLIPKDSQQKQIQQPFNEVRHPLSEGKIAVSIKEESNEIINKIKSVIEDIAKSYRDYSDDKKSFVIWRNLLEDILEKLSDSELKKIFGIIPADTRVPDHSIWEHLKITTATNAGENLQNNSLFLFSLGPVQEFIKQARKTQDFYMGSFLLSYLTFIAMQEIIENFGPTCIIYPDLYKQPLMDWYLKNRKQIKAIEYDPDSVLLPTLPNRFVAILPTTEKQAIHQITEKIKNKVYQEIEQIKQTIFKKLKIHLNEEQKNFVDNQFKDFPKINQVAISWRHQDRDVNIDDLKDFFDDGTLKHWKDIFDLATKYGEYPPRVGMLYQLLYSALEKSHAAIKNQRGFEQVVEEGRKCSVCGERNVMFYLESDKEKFERFNPNAYSLKNIPKKYFEEGEGLCAVCFLKRTLEEYLENLDSIFKDFTFPSTAEVASADFKEKINKENQALWNEYVGELSKIRSIRVSPLPKLKDLLKTNVEGQFFYSENLIGSEIEKDEDFYKHSVDIEKIKKILQQIYKNEKIKKPNPYYAIIYLDGDNMGKWLSGENLPNIEYSYNSEVWKNVPENFKKELIKISEKKFLTPAIHAAISTALRNYTIEFVRTIVEKEYLGKLIYAGGDDVLAFVNLRDLFDVMEKLRWAFSGNIKIENDQIQVDLENTSGFVLKNGTYYLTMGPKATCSMGVVIAHYKEPLKLVLDQVFAAEKIAKKAGKDSFTISLLKHSGEVRTATAKWYIEENQKHLTTKLLKEIKESMDSEKPEYISDGFIQKIAKEFYLLDINDLPEGLFNSELKRLITRAYNSQSKKAKEDKERFILNFYNKLNLIFWQSGNIDKENFINLLHITSFMNRGE